MIVPSKYSKFFDTTEGKGLQKERVCTVYYLQYGGDFDGVEIYDKTSGSWVFVSESQFSESRKALYQGLIQKHLDENQEEGQEFDPDSAA